MKVSKKDYVEGKLQTAAIENCKAYRDWMMDRSSEDWKSRMHLLCRDNREAFKKLWGKPDWHYNNGEFYFHGWVLVRGGETFIVQTAKHKGTCVEIVGADFDSVREKGKAIVEFMNWIWKSLRDKK
jgi:hypothetical protein